MLDLDATIVELEPCPRPRTASAPLREIAFRANAWTPSEIERLVILFRQDVSLEEIAEAIGRGRAGVADKVATLGLRRNSTRPWTDLEDDELRRRYGAEATATLALDFGRSCSAIYARAGCLGLTEGNAPEWTAWEDAQLRAGYARSVPLLQLAALIGRPLSGLSGRAGLLGITHASHPPDWEQAETARALDLATEGYRYTQIIAMMAAEGFPARTLSGFGQIIRKLGYGRGWGRAWTPDEDALLRHAYEAAASLTPLRARLGRTACSLRWRAEYLGLRGTHANRNGWRMGPDWTEAQEALLRERYGKMPNDALAAQLGRTKAAMFSRANLLGLVHGYIRPFSADETRALDLAFRHGIAIADLAAALDRKACSVSKYATNHGIRFGRRPLRTPTPTIDDILALDAPMERGGGAGLGDHVIEQSPERPHADDQHAARDARRERRARRLGRRRPLRHEARRHERRLNRRP